MNSLGQVFRTLAERGFSPLATKKKRGARSFEGALRCAQGDVRVRLDVTDWNFLSYPDIRVLDKPSFLPSLMPHINAAGSLCYFSPGAITLDRYDPAISLLQCLDQAKDVLNKIALDPAYRHDDIQAEFPALWAFGQNKLPWNVLVGDLGEKSVTASLYIIEVHDRKYALISADPAEAASLQNAMGATLTSSTYRCWVFETAVFPSVPDRMPCTVKEVFVWLKNWDKKLYDQLQAALLDKGYLKKQEYVTFGIKSPVGWIGFGFYLDHMVRLGYQEKPERYRQYLHNRGGTKELFRMVIEPVGVSFTHSRNLSFPDLRDKAVTVIGCGAIGSHVANALVRLGAGTGKKGKLKLIDPGILGAENLGRHTLGYPSLFNAKADALKDDLKRQFSYANIVSVSKSAFEDDELLTGDLLIDATGEESVSELLNGMRLDRENAPPCLHIWIRGNGDAVQGLWVDGAKYGCYRCLIVPDSLRHRRERFRLLKKDPDRRTDGCRAFTPYAVSASMYAGALAAEMVSAWLEGNPTPRFRTQAIKPQSLYVVANQDIDRIKGCPACNPI
ncbi:MULTISPECIES: ThiF family adenylyltransferase [Herbaspirillum]|uniref:ThiF family adenylyltransferase n=3 Tax=Pseudomonadota TaxID=1224 RepID=UPI0024DEA7E8